MRKLFPLLLAAAALLSCAREISPEAVLTCVQPPALQPGDKIALISPAYFTSKANVDTASAILRAWGFEPVLGPNVGKEYLGYYAGTDQERLADLKWALKDKSIKAILCNRGGYGTIHLTRMLPLQKFAAHPKWLIGFSDITTLHGMANRAGVMSIHGTMCSLMAKSHGLGMTNTLLRDLLSGTVPQYEVPAHPLSIPGHAQGTLVGGNLSTFSPVLGTEADATLAGGIILYIEEVEEDMSHIDRMINTLVLNGVFDRCQGVILGEFTDCEANLQIDSVEELICGYLRDRHIPVLCGFPAGHGDVNLPLILGAPVTLDVRPDGATLRFDVAGQAQTVATEDACAELAQNL
ncbi:MAG: LD-carboxypeptidase [Bacteroidales bacterium]|nr:LD-carboxypeptidase [Bacteroidales bacterium]MDY6444491.1 LD-carboxypeptidase [Bacteroidales bacterium]